MSGHLLLLPLSSPLFNPTVTVVCGSLLGFSVLYNKTQSGAWELTDGCELHSLVSRSYIIRTWVDGIGVSHGWCIPWDLTPDLPLPSHSLCPFLYPRVAIQAHLVDDKSAEESTRTAQRKVGLGEDTDQNPTRESMTSIFPQAPGPRAGGGGWW